MEEKLLHDGAKNTSKLVVGLEAPGKILKEWLNIGRCERVRG